MEAEIEKKVVPFDTGKVKIGLHYVRDNRPAMSVFEERLQDALLGKTVNGLPRWFDTHPRLAPLVVFGALVLLMTIVSTIENL